MKEIKVIYRISDKGRPKKKLPNATKQDCLMNAAAVFGHENIYVVADNCSPELIEFINSNNFPYEETSLGNTKSFLYALRKAINTYPPETFLYMLEDDYLHTPDSKKILLEGMEIADYVTLYDHKDQYMLCEEGGSPFNHDGQFHRWKVFVTESTHWRETPSTTMTVCARVSTFKEDYKIWLDQPRPTIPMDFMTFIRLTRQRNPMDFISILKTSRRAALRFLMNYFPGRPKRLLVSPLPACSTHAELEYISPVIDWSKC